ncbi:bifunctional folylpolyglutamate synthase/dihydrofolate synthase [Thermonema rossianum]|uniref:bifunctional folylpolyglutamate synthase/dihydrofolate synthase n=1 Tax=Thermonema rossianum TaxID=55505 RepID=UPI000570A875|nr:Mur ligase family protein [Thermonema rossianum]
MKKPPFEHYEEAVAWLYGQLPLFEKQGAAAYKPGLERMEAMAALLGHPEGRFRAIHIAGTNGKGSVAHLLANALYAAGYKTALFTSPHIHRFAERIRVDGKEVPAAFVLDFVNRHHALVERFRPTFFEWVTLMAFDFFARQEVDVAVVEVGMGGRLDATNILMPEMGVITRIALDHQQFLGDTLAQIAAEKAGIIKKGMRVVIGCRQAETTAVYEEKAAGQAARLLWAEDKAGVAWGAFLADGRRRATIQDHTACFDIETPLTAAYQADNLLTAWVTFKEWMTTEGRNEEAQAAFRKGACLSVFRLKGRWQRLRTQALVFADAAHNEEGIRALCRQIEQMRPAHCRWVIGLAADKNLPLLASCLPAAKSSYYCCAARSPRALAATQLAAELQKQALEARAYTSVNEALQAAMHDYQEGELIVVAGSHFILAELPEALFE